MEQDPVAISSKPNDRTSEPATNKVLKILTYDVGQYSPQWPVMKRLAPLVGKTPDDVEAFRKDYSWGGQLRKFWSLSKRYKLIIVLLFLSPILLTIVSQLWR
jgi:hypothetical protein